MGSRRKRRPIDMSWYGLIADAIKHLPKIYRKVAHLRWGSNSLLPKEVDEVSHQLGLLPSEVIRMERQIRTHLLKSGPYFEDFLNAVPLSKSPITDAVTEPVEHIATFELAPHILLATDEIWRRLVDEFAKHPQRLQLIPPREFEELVAFLFKEFGYQVELTKQTRDGGRDIIALRHAEVSLKYLIECKRPESHKKVGIGPVRELYGVKLDEGASKAILATTTYFTHEAHLFMERHKWELEPRDYNGLLEWIQRYKAAQSGAQGS